ncbi:hypothetical protein LEP1GSC079_1442 [Leptospira interrogans str. FPW1039]|uniref:Uncharacterized protein n=1 Tax=Leptospira interrogans str. FPW1039 TaxID=1193040 RepID=A0A0F6IG23_LEPIR|nr:hypothetical protein LEP1GSC079_1442 [Leptospira interrogans str. FPW1039]
MQKVCFSDRGKFSELYRLSMNRVGKLSTMLSMNRVRKLSTTLSMNRVGKLSTMLSMNRVVGLVMVING